MHSSEGKVSQIMARSAELSGIEKLRYRRRAYRLLSVQGQGRFNARQRRVNPAAPLIPARRSKDISKYLECPECYGLFKDVRRHDCAKNKSATAKKNIKYRARRRMALMSDIVNGNTAVADVIAPMRSVKSSLYAHVQSSIAKHLLFCFQRWPRQRRYTR